MDLDNAARVHVARFNAAVESGDWTSFAETFTDGAHMEFTSVPVGPFHGRVAITGAYVENPPDDTMSVVEVDPIDADTARVHFRWDHDGPGTMRLRWRDGEVENLQITFG